ncbi:MAG: DUF4390 domain-containing protein [Methyloprofundus sp.]|nr:DUF4390 domain-containing protein [Methyloprofundus sp.]MBW6453315.1 DUF4390 domain-containing protein [Methyloprofundus sp.]
MRAYKKNKALLLTLLLLLCALSGYSYADDRFVHIAQAQLTLAENTAQLRADVVFQLSRSAEEALHSGIALHWDVAVELKQVRWGGLWQNVLFSEVRRYRLAYYTLLNNYRVKDEKKAGEVKRFSSLLEALAYMGQITYDDVPIVGYDPKLCVGAVLNVSFDKEMLPAPLRPIAYFDSEWDLSATKRLWCE